LQVGSDLVIDLDLNGEFNVETDVTIVNFFSAEISSSFSLVGNLTGTEIIENFAITIIEGTPEDDVLEGTAGNDAIQGMDGNDMLVSGGGNDILDGGDGDDILVCGGTGNVTLIGGAGIDAIEFINVEVGLEIDLSLGVAINGNFTNTISGFEVVSGSDFDDMIAGTGSESLIGGGGGDTLTGGAYCDGGDGDDILVGGGTGNSTLIGGVGIDAVSYANVSTGVEINLSTSLAVSAGFSNNISGFEVVVGSDFNDIITGGDIVVTLQGGLGDDVYQLNATNAAGCLIEDVTGINTLILEGITLSFDGAAGTIAVLQSGADLVIDLDGNLEVNLETDLTIANFFSGEVSSSFQLVGNLTGDEIIDFFASPLFAVEDVATLAA